VEACDDGNRSDADACLNTCKPAVCGDGVLQEGVEACDDGNDVTEGCEPGQTTCMVCSADCEEILVPEPGRDLLIAAALAATLGLLRGRRRPMGA
jgi:hypothetical protein